jgi:hypothetical protein
MKKVSPNKRTLPMNVVARLGYDPTREARTDAEKKAMDIDILYQSIRIARKDYTEDSRVMPLDPREKEFEFAVKSLRASGVDADKWRVKINELYEACVELRRQRTIHMPPPRGVVDVSPVPAPVTHIIVKENDALVAKPICQSDKIHSPTGESQSSGKTLALSPEEPLDPLSELFS